MTKSEFVSTVNSINFILSGRNVDDITKILCATICDISVSQHMMNPKEFCAYLITDILVNSKEFLNEYQSSWKEGENND